MTTTTLIQTKLYEKADASTKEKVNDCLSSLVKWRGQYSGIGKIRIQIRSVHELFCRDGKRFVETFTALTGDKGSIAELITNSYVTVDLWTLIELLRVQLFDGIVEREREAFVDSFISEVERLKTEVEELSSRVDL